MDNNLENIAAMFLSNSKGMTNPQQPETVNIGGQNILVNRSGDRFGNAMRNITPSLQNLAANYMQIKQTQKRNQFMKSASDIMAANTTPDDKINKLMQLKTMSGSDYGLGIDDIVGQYNKMAERTIALGNGQSSIPEGMEITGYDQKGKPMIRKKAEKKISAAEEKRNVEERKLSDEFGVLLNSFERAKKEGQGIPNFGSLGIKGRIAGKFSGISGKAGYSPAINVYNAQRKAFATVVAKAAGEIRPTDEDIKRFVETLPDVMKSDEENALLIGDIQEKISKGNLGNLWKKSKDKKTIKLPSGKTITLGQ